MGKRKLAVMKAVEWEGKTNHVSVKDVDVPTIQHPLDAIIRLTTAGISGSDLHILHGRIETESSLTLGHEMVGIIEHVGEGVETLKSGDRVLVHGCISCGFCENCVKGLRTLCLTVNPPFEDDSMGGRTHGIALNGGQAQYVRVPYATENTILLEPGTAHELDYLLLCDSFPSAWTCLDFANFQPGDTVAVFGAGPVGLLCAYSALIRGASRVYSIDDVQARLDKAKSMSAIPIDFSKGDPVAQIMELEPRGVDRACDCVGFECVNADGKNVVNEVLVNAINVTRPGGGIGQVGVYVTSDAGGPNAKVKNGVLEIPWGTLWEKGLSIRAGAVTPHIHAPMLKNLIESGRAHPSFVFGAETTIEDAPATYKRFSNREISKPFIRFKK